MRKESAEKGAALLELLRLGRVSAEQDGIFGDMVLEARQGEPAEGDLQIDGYE